MVISGDALTDIDLRKLLERHNRAGGIATLTVKKVPDTREYGVVIHDADGRIQGFQEKPDPAEALSDLGNCGIYVFSPEIFDYFPDRPFADWAQDVFPALLENDVPFYVHEIDEYWNDVGSLHELKEGTFDVLEGKLKLERTGHRARRGPVRGRGHPARRRHVRRPAGLDRPRLRDRRGHPPDGPARDRRRLPDRRHLGAARLDHLPRHGPRSPGRS